MLTREKVKCMSDDEIKMYVHSLNHLFVPEEVTVVREFDGAAHAVWRGSEIGICQGKSRPWLDV